MGMGSSFAAMRQRTCSVDGLGSGDAETSQDCLPVTGLALREHRCGANNADLESCVVCPNRLMEQASRTAGPAEHLHTIVIAAVIIIPMTMAVAICRISDSKFTGKQRVGRAQASGRHTSLALSTRTAAIRSLPQSHSRRKALLRKGTSQGRHLNYASQACQVHSRSPLLPPGARHLKATRL